MGSLIGVKVPLERMSEQAYSDVKAISASHLRSAHRHPKAMLKRYCSRSGFEVGEWGLGNLVHYYILEPDEASSKVVVLPSVLEHPRRVEDRKKRAAFLSQYKAQGKVVVPESLHEKVQRGVEALRASKDASDLWREAECEGGLVWNDEHLGVLAKAKFDICTSSSWIWDLKCFRGGCRESEFVKGMHRSGLFIQAWWYQEGARQTGVAKGMAGHLILDTETWTVRLRPISEDEIELGRLQALRAWKILESLSIPWVEAVKLSN